MGRCSTRPSPSAATCRCRPISRPGARPTSRTAPTTRPLFAHDEGSVAAPTAGLHFTDRAAGAARRRAASRLHKVTLHVGAGTFLPVKADDTEGHNMHAEFGTVSAETAAALNAARAKGGRIVAVGSTALRLLESAAGEDGRLQAFSGETAIFITPGYTLPRGRPDADQFPSAALDAVHAGVGLQRPRHHETRLCARDRGAAIASIPTAMRVCFILPADERTPSPSRLIKTDGAARRGEFVTPHGAVQTPAFMPVGTQAHGQGADAGRRARRPAPRSCSATPII